MQAPQRVVKAVSAALKMKARSGKTTKRDVRLAVVGKINQGGGPTKYGIGVAMMQVAIHQVVDTEITRQMKMPLTEHQQKYVLPALLPLEIIAAIGKVQQWIAISDGTNAIWVPSLQAAPADWFANYDLKEKKAAQTQGAADVSLDIGRFLTMFNFTSLSEAMTKGPKEPPQQEG